KRGATIGAFVNGLLLSFAPALLLPVLGNLGFQNTTFGDFDFGVLGIILGKASDLVGKAGIYVIVAIILAALIIPSFMKTKSKALNNIVEE
uniref:PTS transporter subunit IIC n=1 Tax=Clostridium polynesiense TaxID=1325933 RepID=UPI00058B6511